MIQQNRPTTELEAINTMLATIGEAPVSTINGAVTVDVTIAVNTLNEVNRAVQGHGWYFNTEVNYTLQPDTLGTIRPPPNTLRLVFTKNNPNLDPVFRAGVIYDRTNKTTNFLVLAPGGLVAKKLVLFLAFEDLPDSARHYITIHAARLFQQRVQASPLIEQFTAIEEAAAMRELQSDESATAGLNIKNVIGVGRFFNRMA